MINNSRELYIEFKVYGFYTEVAKDLKCTSDQVSAIYDWILNKTLTEFKQKDDAIQMEIKGLGKLHFDPKKGYIHLNKNIIYKMVRSIDIINSVLFDEKGNLKELTIQEAGRNFIHVKATVNKHKKLTEAVRIYKIKLDRFYIEGNLIERQYHYLKNRLEKTLEQHSKNYESIQRILETYPERFQEFRQDF